MALWRVLVTAAILGVTEGAPEGSTPFAQLPCGSMFLGYATHTCLQLQLVPGSASGACAEPGQSNPSGDPVLVDSFNISANSPGVANVVVTDVNGTRLGTGNGLTSDSRAWSMFDLTFECVTPGSKRVFPHAPCSCHAVLQTYYSFNCDGVCNVSGCNYNYNNAPSQECGAHSANGCVVCNDCGMNGQDYCQFNSSLVSLQSFWEVSCSFAVQSDPSAANILGAQQVMCGATYFEVGSTRSGFPESL